jgi:hypothetical protein
VYLRIRTIFSTPGHKYRHKALEKHFFVGSQVVTAVSKQMAVFWFVAPCVRTHTQEAVKTSETVVNLRQSTCCYNPEDSHLQIISGLGLFFKEVFLETRNYFVSGTDKPEAE